MAAKNYNDDALLKYNLRLYAIELNQDLINGCMDLIQEINNPFLDITKRLNSLIEKHQDIIKNLKEDNRRLDAAIDQLKDSNQEVIIKRYVEEKEINTIADEMFYTRSTVQRKIAKSVNQINTILCSGTITPL